MDGFPPGTGTVVNVAAIVVGSLIGLVAGHRIPQRTRDVATDCLGLVTVMVAALAVAEVTSPDLRAAVPSGAPALIVLGSLVLGAIPGSLLGIEARIERLAGVLQRRLDPQPRTSENNRPSGTGSARERFIEGFLTTSLLFCIGPLAILGALSDGMGHGIDQLALKALLDGIASIAFAATFGVGVIFSAAAVLVVQGGLTILGLTVGALLPDAHVAALTVVGGLLLLGVAIRLLRLRDLPVGDMLPALLVAPVLTDLVARL